MMISIIIPVYKVEDFIGSCLNSVCQQTYSEIEVILVDDCSPDRSMAVAEPFICELKKKFPVKVIRHEKNKGLSAARNTGVMNSLGDYLFFLDSDDELPKNAMLSFVACLQKFGNVDFLIGNAEVIGDFCCKRFTEEMLLTTNEQIVDKYISEDLYVMAWGKLIKRSFFLEKDLWFIEGLLHEDEYFSFRLMIYSSTAVIVKDYVYKYVVRHSGSITATKGKKNYVDYLRIITLKIDLMLREATYQKEPKIYSFFVSVLYGFTTYVIETECLRLNEKAMMLQEVRTLKDNLKQFKKRRSLQDSVKKWIINIAAFTYYIIIKVRS
ncbi:Glycosyltransferase involved in cell wall bisynthesis [Bacteroides faecichinchillae]|uniref:Glycosyltransferase involved in cell wall bisynthesis n=2 Tax=Bacteroides faecichinchillae TaxID=871325 RepID=A0A1M5DVL5_9BACE|nr:glycosyltransferase family 2 protein [Bacteroides faecichinchillae]THG64548.1 glycosyltransferase [Bacteroides faecichinchillae]SHF70985.1 Glycosyltransferase involved in cell wall bisynthesis [Bacteroides faecichinchillae]